MMDTNSPNITHFPHFHPHLPIDRPIAPAGRVWCCIIILLMDEGILDVSKIPRFEFELHNEELANCIKELHFQLKAQDKKLDKFKRDIELKLNEAALTDALTEVAAAIDIHPQLLKGLPLRNDRTQDETPLRASCSRLSLRTGQLSDVLRVVADRVGNLERRAEQAEAAARQQVAERVGAVQGQLEEFKKAQLRDNRAQAEAVLLAQGRFEEKLKEVETKTLWQINDCKVKLSDRVNEQFVKDQARETETKILNKVREATGRGAVDPKAVDALETRCVRLEKELEVKVVEMAARVAELRDSIDNSLASKKELAQEKLENEKRAGSLQLALAELARRARTCEQDIEENTKTAKALLTQQEATCLELGKVSKLVANLKLSDDFMKLMQNLDPHKICEIDTSISTLADRQLKAEREVDALRRYFEKFKEKMEMGNIVAAGDHPPRLDKDEVGRVLQELLTGHAAFKKISVFEGQLFEFRAYGESIAELSKRVGKLQKEFDLQPLVYGLRGLEEYMKKELLVVNGRVGQLEAQLNEDKRRRPLSAKKPASDTKISSSVSFKRLVPVDCISCFQNPIAERTPDRYRK